MAKEDDPGRLEECTPFWRRHLQSGKAEGESDKVWENSDIAAIYCSYRDWFFSQIIGSTELGYYVGKLDVVRKRRRCLDYIKYQPGFGPEEHKELKRKAETRKTTFKATLFGAIIS